MKNNNKGIVQVIIESLSLKLDIQGGAHQIVDWKKIEDYHYGELTKKDQEHKAGLEMIRGEIESSPGYSICSAHQTWNENCKLCGNAQISKEDAISIIDSHINKLSTE